MLNKKALLLAVCGALSGGSAEQTIGAAGQQGFGVGPYGGDEADLIAMGLSPMDGCYDITSDNYGNYLHTNGSVMVFIPAFCYRMGYSTAPSYSTDGALAIEIRDAQEFAGFVPGASFTSASMGDGWILARAFVDGGIVKRGFFIDKYLCSKSASNSNVAVSVKNGDPIQLTTSSSYNYSGGMSGCEGYLRDAMLLSANRGAQYCCCSAFMWAAISILSMAHGQASTSTTNCAWWSSGSTNFPKGNNSSLKDYNDSTVTFVQAGNTGSTGLAKTGSASDFAKTTHNGQASGITDVAGNLRQTLVGWDNPSSATEWYLKPSIAVRSITKSNYTTSSNYDIWSSSGSSDSTKYWGTGAFFTDVTGYKWSACGLRPSTLNSSGNAKFGNDTFVFNYNSGRALCGGGYWGEGQAAGVWFRNGYYDWNYIIYDYRYGFRCAGYAG